MNEVKSNLKKTNMKTILTNFVDSSNVLNTFINIKYLWENERWYKNFDDYTEVMIQSIKKETQKDVKLIKGTKRPFGVSLDIKGLKFNLFLKTSGRSAWLPCKKI